MNASKELQPHEPGFPLFLLGIVLLPTETAALHVFEDRYLTMIRSCIAKKREFGVVWSAEDGLRSVGCAATITEVVDNLDDGGMNILVTGTTPFEIVTRESEMEYPAAEIKRLSDENDVVRVDAIARAHEAYAQLVVAATDLEPDSETLTAMTAYEMAATVELGPNAKQGLLELRAEQARLRLVARLFETGIKMIEQAKEVGARAKSNGKVRFGADQLTD